MDQYSFHMVDILAWKVRFIVPVFCYSNHTKTKGALNMEYTIRQVRDHVEVYTREGRFLFSADTMSEARQELREEYSAA